MPHSVHTHLSRWEVFTQMQNPDLKPTNYQSILPYIGNRTITSCNVGIIKLNGKEFLLGDAGSVCTGEKLIRLMKEVEGEKIDVYWLDGNDGKVLKALVFIGSQYICEAVAKPTYHRAKIEQTEQDKQNREIMSAYVATIEGFGRRQKSTLEPLTILDNTPQPKKTFIMPGIKQATIVEEYQAPEILEERELEEKLEAPDPGRKSMLDRWYPLPKNKAPDLIDTW